jgi:hypothetical protein
VLVDAAAVIAIYGDLAATATDYCSFTRLDGGDIADIACREIVLVLFGDVDVLLEILRGRSQRNA